MKRQIEVELKYSVLEPLDVDKLGIQFVERKRVLDIYYDTPEGKLFEKGIFIRNRNDQKLDFKFNFEDIAGKNFKNDHTHCDEYSFEIPLLEDDATKFRTVCEILEIIYPKGLSLENFLAENSFVQLAVVDKERTMARKNGFEISIDKVVGLGDFIEIEKIIRVDIEREDYEEELNRTKRKIDTFARSLGLMIKQNTTGYCELVLRETNFELYKQGKYVLDEDKSR
ncbi:MAG: CYTH domain-containing protein [Candidatus Dojkabacteria bacterium]|nr:CYTH domain-containing protein [Candidatus Dojkabacteria bacterium]